MKFKDRKMAEGKLMKKEREKKTSKAKAAGRISAASCWHIYVACNFWHYTECPQGAIFASQQHKIGQDPSELNPYAPRLPTKHPLCLSQSRQSVQLTNLALLWYWYLQLYNNLTVVWATLQTCSNSTHLCFCLLSSFIQNAAFWFRMFAQSHSGV